MAVNIALFGAFLLMATVFGFFLWQTLFAPKEYGSGEEQSKPAYTEQQSSKEQPTGSSFTQSPTKGAADETVAEYTKWLAIFTMFLVLATIGLFISGERNVDAARKSANAAKDSADATRNAVELSERVAQHQLRAYIYLDKAIIILDGRTLKGEVEMKNSGQTPAYDLTVKIRMQTMEAANPVEFQPASAAVPAIGIVGPGTKFYAGTEVTIPETNQIAIPGFIDGRGLIYLIGQVQYRDAFNKIWVLDFRMRSKVFEGDHWAMQPAEEGNKETKKE